MSIKDLTWYPIYSRIPSNRKAEMYTLLFLLGFTIFVGVVFFCIMGVE